MSRLGGITYGRLTEGIELPRPDWDEVSTRTRVFPSGCYRPILMLSSVPTDAKGGRARGSGQGETGQSMTALGHLKFAAY